VDGEAVSIFNSAGEQTVSLSAGRHTLEVVAKRSAEGGYRQVELTTLAPSYPIRIEVPNYRFSSAPPLSEADFGSGVWTGYLVHGAEFTFEADGGTGVAFTGWTGDLAGKEASGSLVVQGPIEAKGSFTFSTYELNGIAW